jgi:hypothetical protein
LGELADLEGIDADRLSDVLESSRAEIDDGKVKSSLHLTIGVLGETDRAGVGDALDSRRDVDPVAHQVAVRLLDDVAQMNSDPELDTALGLQASVARDHAALYLDRAAHGIDNAAKLNETTIAGAFDDAPAMRGDRGINQIAAQRPQPRKGPLLVRPDQPAITDNIGDQDRRDLPCVRHSAPLASWR